MKAIIIFYTVANKVGITLFSDILLFLFLFMYSTVELLPLTRLIQEVFQGTVSKITLSQSFNESRKKCLFQLHGQPCTFIKSAQYLSDFNFKKNKLNIYSFPIKIPIKLQFFFSSDGVGQRGAVWISSVPVSPWGYHEEWPDCRVTVLPHWADRGRGLVGRSGTGCQAEGWLHHQCLWLHAKWSTR